MFASVIRHGTLVAVVSLLLALLGVLAVLRIPVQMIPDLEVRTITVQTRWPGATPQDIEKDILIEQEEFLRSLPGLRRMTATAISGAADIELEFPFDIDITETLIRVNNELSRVSGYPENVNDPRIVAASFSSNAFMYFRVATLPDNPRQLELTLMRDFLEDNVRPRMEAISGVSEVTVSGGAERQIQIWLDPERLSALGLTVGDVRDALRARNRDVSGGDLDQGKRRYLLRTVGRFESLEEMRQLILVRRGDSVVRLGEVARVVQDHFTITQVSRVDGEPVLGMQVRRESGSNVIDIKRAMLTEVAALNTEVLAPAGLEMKLTSDDVRYVEASVRNVWTNLALGAVFATLVMLAFLRSWRATLVGMSGIPLCLLAAFLGLLLAGRTLNVISLAGVAFAIGMTVDNSIVVLESIERERRRGLDRLAAALAGVRHVAPAVLASTLTTVLVFLPVLFIAEEAGQLYSDIAVAISAAILVSMAVALTVVPTLAARVDFRASFDGADQPTGPMTRAALGTVGWLLAGRVRRIGAITATALLALWIGATLTPPAEYLPEGEEAKTFASMSPPPGYNLAEMLGVAEQVEAAFLPHIDADRSAFDAGETPVPPIAYVNLSVQPDRLRIVAETVEPRDIDALMDALTAHYESYPGMRAFAARGSIISSNDGGTRSINLDIAGPRLETLYAVAAAADRRAREVLGNPRIQSQPASLSLAQPLIEVRPDWDRAAELGLNSAELGFTVAALTDGAYIDEFFLDDDRIDIYAYGPAGPEPRLAALAGMPIRTPQGTTLPLSTVAQIEERVDVSQVRRVDGRRTVTLNIIPPRSVALEAGVEQVRREVIGALREEGAIPRDVSVTISGAADQLDATRDALLANFSVALLIVYLVLVAIFTHWGYPLLILTTIPLGLVSGIAGLALLNAIGALLPALGFAAIVQPFDMISMLGFLILLGTVVNNPILVVDQARALRTQNAGLPASEAVQQAVASRLRPIAMTTLTTICGLLPLVLLPGEGSELYRGVGAIVLAGLVGAALVTLVFMPPMLAFAIEFGDRLSSTARRTPH
ncbi:MAG: efflux RND transporter permease subunit [Methylibium sp.]|uniref:efflux RND transporter permease subunit n=1 Tax=Methylibium sp. TaxID=2067992 RepID=UPI001826246E|nr:efflux RND transporter permease subunit [Methylibium sp.]MBA3598531.1 efflux RND transporter permease subunit [Methylibium sp.]